MPKTRSPLLRVFMAGPRRWRASVLVVLIGLAVAAGAQTPATPTYPTPSYPAPS